MKVSLVMVNASGDKKEFAVKRLPSTIGRGDDCDIRVPVASVSRKHCELLDDDEELVIRDLGSSNGTFVNREKVDSRELSPGDLLAIGPMVFVVRIDGHPQSIDAEAAFSGGSMSPDGQPGNIGGVPTWGGGGGGGGSKDRSGSKTGGSGAGKPGSLLDGDPDDSDFFDIDLTDKPKHR